MPLLGQIVIGFLDVLLAGILWNEQDPKKASKKDQRDIKKAYHNLAKLWYSDKKEEGKKEEATEKFQSNSDTSRRQLYLSQFQLLPSHIQLLPSHLQLFPSHRAMILQMVNIRSRLQLFLPVGITSTRTG